MEVSNYMLILHKAPCMCTELVSGRIVTFGGTARGLTVFRFNNITKRHTGVRPRHHHFAGNQF